MYMIIMKIKDLGKVFVLWRAKCVIVVVVLKSVVHL